MIVVGKLIGLEECPHISKWLGKAFLPLLKASWSTQSVLAAVERQQLFHNGTDFVLEELLAERTSRHRKRRLLIHMKHSSLWTFVHCVDAITQALYTGKKHHERNSKSAPYLQLQYRDVIQPWHQIFADEDLSLLGFEGN